VVVIGLVAKGILAGLYPQALILSGGVILLFISACFFPQTPLVESSTGSRFMDVFASVSKVFSNNIMSLGLTIMVIDGFARYMLEIGASQQLVKLSVKPLGRVKSGYILLGGCFILIQLLALFIPSPSGLSLLLIYTLYPVLRSVGCSKGAVAAVIASICINYGPAEVGTILIAELSGHNLIDLFLHQQVPVLAIVFPAIGVLHMFMQRYWDRREQRTAADDKYDLESDAPAPCVPRYYAVLPVMPLLILFVFSDIAQGFFSSIPTFHVDIISAMLASFFMAFFVDSVRSLNIKDSVRKVNVFFEQMGKSFISIVSVLICAQILAEGLLKIGFIEILFSYLPASEHTQILMVIFFSLFIFISAVILGSSTTFNAFAPLAAEMVRNSGASSVRTLLSMYYSAGFGRAFSPIAGFVIIVSRVVGLKPSELIKRNAVQLVAGYLLTLILNTLLVR
jgi:DcuC family C4-dicarboxylate transporter